MNGLRPRGAPWRAAWRSTHGGLLLLAAGCASITNGGRPSGLPPAPIVAYEPPASADGATSPRLYWVPAWRLYLREGDVVEHGGRYYSFRADRWNVADTPRGPWASVEASRPPSRGAGAPVPERTVPAVPEQTAPATPERTVPATPEPDRHAVAAVAMKYVGTPYAWGGTSPAGFDCSGFVQYVYGKIGVALPRTVREQYRVGTPVSRDALAVGDLVFFDRLRHNGIYIGSGRFIHAARSGDTVRVSSLDEGWFRQRWVGARRLHASGAPRA